MTARSPTARSTGEIVRQRLIDALDARWAATVTLIEAPAGFGKSVALAQAVSSNAEDPVGVDVVIECRRFHAEATELATAISDALDAVVPGTRGAVRTAGGAPIDRVLAAVAARLPTVVTLILDDTHHLRASEGAVDLLARLVREMPSNLRLVLAGRSLPPLPLARAEAAGRVVRIGSADLVFTGDELGTVADRLGALRSALTDIGGWPALTRLAIAAGTVGPIDFLLEEIVDELDAEHRRALAAIVMGRGLSVEDLKAVADGGALRHVLATVPLVDARDGAGRDATGAATTTAHDLWAEALDRIVGPTERGAIAVGLGELLLARGAYREAAELGAEHRSWTTTRRALLGLAMGGESFPSATRLVQLRERITGHDQEPEVVLLDALIARLGNDPTRGRALAEQALEQFLPTGEVAAIAAAGFEVGLAAWLTGDLGRVLEIYELARTVTARGNASLVPLMRVVEAVVADLRGDAARAVSLLAEVDLGAIPPSLAVYVLSERISKLQLIGRPAEALSLIRQARQHLLDPRLPFTVALAHWMAGDPRPVVTPWRRLRHQRVGHNQTDFLGWVYSSHIDAGLGIEEPAEQPPYPIERSREQAFLALTTAVRAVTAGDEAAAARAIEALAVTPGFDDPLCRGELRRLPAVAWMLSEPARRAIGDGAHEGGDPRLAPARLLADLRRGGDRTAGPDGPGTDWAAGIDGPGTDWAAGIDRSVLDAGRLLTALPLRWTAELLARLADVAVRSPTDRELAERVVATAERIDGLTDGRLRRLLGLPAFSSLGGAEALGARLAPGPGPVRLHVFGTVAISHWWNDDGPGPVSRSRVRQLLGLLVLRDPIGVDELTDLLWPDMTPEDARSNLAASLRLARAVVDATDGDGRRRPVEESLIVRDRSTVRLRRADMSCDLWDVLALVERLERNPPRPGAPADADTTRSDRPASTAPGPAGGSADELLTLGLGALLTDLDDVVGVRSDIEAARGRIRRAATDLADRHLAAGRPTQSLHMTTRVLDGDPYDERAHTTRIHAAADLRDTDAVRLAVAAAGAALADLGVTAPRPLAMALRRAASILGRDRPSGHQGP